MLFALLAGCPSPTPQTSTPIAPVPTPPAPDADGDGSRPPEDCDDTDATVFPGAPETWYDGIDSDCDGADDFDQDGDGARPPPDGGDCDDTDPTVLPIPGWDPSDVCTCGNGLVEVGEACEPSASGPYYTCAEDCSGPCGDGVPSADTCLLLLASGTIEDYLVGVADMDGDGRKDLLVLEQNPDALAYVPYQANGSFGAPIPLVAGRLAAVGDIDGDGTTDLVTTEYQVGVTVHLRTATGISSTLLTEHEGSAMIADFDGNGRADVMVMNVESGSWLSFIRTHPLLYFQDAPGAFDLRPPATTVFDGRHSGYPAEIADRDGDGHVEALFTHVGLCDDGPTLLEFDGALTATVVRHPDGDSYISDLFDADLDGDGCLESIGNGGPTNALFPCGADRADPSQFQPLVIPALDGTLSTAGDLLGTGTDVLIAWRFDGTHDVLYRPTPGVPYEAYPLGAPHMGRIYDLDGDGRDEILTWWSQTGVVEVHRWDQ